MIGSIEMEQYIHQVFINSNILIDMTEDDEPLTITWISANLYKAIPEYETILSKITDFKHMVDNQHSMINDIPFILGILHRYDIRKYYNELLKSVALLIINFSFSPFTLLNDIIYDVIHIEPDFTRILRYIIYDTNDGLRFTDFILSVPLLDKLFAETQIINPEIAKLLPQTELEEFQTFGIANFRNDYRNLSHINLDIIVKHGLQDVIENLFVRGLIKTNTYCCPVVIYGKLEMLKWALSNGFPVDGETFNFAACGDIYLF